ncbi:uncharacterized protein LOC130629909 [Hydractinia symbiolongicarpus]|uniref:uncharacterized protein LOC130629909 n=1 Tax=Hydractinia symbiolongicarpus TaxID=13093 RepID=UPI00254FEAC4|nr:uncharacterized protein LOC130629909 [Hydractinia symbiolongicarpus]
MLLLTYVAILLLANNYVLSDVLHREAKHNNDVLSKLEAIEDKVDQLDDPKATEVSKNALNAANNILIGYKQQDVLGVILGFSSMIDTFLTLFGIPGLATPIVKLVATIVSLFSVKKPQITKDKFDSALENHDLNVLNDKVENAILDFNLYSNPLYSGNLDEKFDAAMNYRTPILTKINIYCGEILDKVKCIKSLEILSKYSLNSQLMIALAAGDKHYEKIKTKLDNYRMNDAKNLEFLYKFNKMKSEQMVILHEIYYNPQQYVTYEYVRSLSKNRVEPYIYVCEEEELKGACYTITKSKCKLKDYTIKSMIIPLGLDVTLTKYKNKKIGPFKGMSVYSSDEKLNEYSCAKIKQDESSDASRYVRICRENGWCDIIPKKDGEFKSINGIDWRNRKLSSIFVPDGMTVKIEEKDQKENGEKKIPVVIYGRHLVNLKKSFWMSLKEMFNNNNCLEEELENYHMSITERGKNTHPGSPKNSITYNIQTSDLNTEDKVLLCNELYGMGLCIQKTEGKFSYDLPSHLCKFDVKSVIIPSSMEVKVCKQNSKCSNFKSGITWNLDEYEEFDIVIKKR